jgi:5-methylcytosine-specific restriction enzyme subunit McrC
MGGAPALGAVTDFAHIPIANIYYLFCYAWNRFEEAKALSTGTEESPDLPNLLAKVLLTGTKALIRRGLDRGYRLHQEDLGTVRGRIELEGSIRLRVKRTPRLSCLLDELTHDVLHNQIIKATMSRLARASTLEAELAQELRHVARSYRDVSDIRLSQSAFGRVTLHRNNAYYDLLLKICRLAYDLMLPERQGAGYAFQDVLRDERKMAMVFEDFVRNFYRIEQRRFQVKPLQLEWSAVPLPGCVGRLPAMRTDIYLECIDRRIIIDTKYYADALQRHHDAPSFRSDNLYQLFAYLRNDAMRVPDLAPAEGMLLYPRTGKPLDGRFEIHGHRISIATLDLSQPWKKIEGGLRALIAEDRERPARVGHP